MNQPSTRKPLIEIQGLGVEVGEPGRQVAIVEDVSFAIAPGEVMALVGESGCGKSMTALAIMRLVPRPLRISQGTRVVFDGENLLELSVPEMRDRRGEAISMIFQDPMTSLNPVITVGEQVAEAVRLHEAGVSEADVRKRVVDLFGRTGIPEPERRFATYPHQLSGGLKQRVMIAMALILRPRLLIADEPTTALDVTVQAQIIALLRELQTDFNTAILLITHDLGVVNELADRVAVMYAGRIVEQAPRVELLTNPSHPYTQGLLGAIPQAGGRGEALAEIAGVVPAPGEGPIGCRFATRCPISFEPCDDIRPETTEIRPGHDLWCHARAREVAR